MKKLILFLTLFVTFFVISCNSDDDNNNSGNQGPNPSTAAFTWRENDPNSTTVQSAFTPTFSTQFKTLIAKTQAGTTLFEINLSGTTPATYSLTTAANVLSFTGVNPTFVSENGSVVITANANNKISGTFEAFRAGSSGVTRLYGTFTDVIIVP